MVSSHFFNLIVWGFCSIIYKGEVRRMTDRTSSGQQKLEAHVAKTLQENNIQQKDLINGMMQADDAGCSFADKTITFAFPVQPWQANRAGHLHGGIICTAFDMTIAALARFFAGKNYAPTISLDVKFIRPVKVGDRMLVTAKAVAAGRRITQLTCEAYSEQTGKLLAAGASVYMNVDTVKERRETEEKSSD